MRTTLKIILPLIVSVAAVSLLFAAYQVRTRSAFCATTSRAARKFSARVCRKMLSRC